jgi:hypothetical protein
MTLNVAFNEDRIKVLLLLCMFVVFNDTVESEIIFVSMLWIEIKSFCCYYYVYYYMLLFVLVVVWREK